MYKRKASKNDIIYSNNNELINLLFMYIQHNDDNSDNSNILVD
jgi:hypothetical protein